MKLALYHFVGTVYHVIAQVIEAKLVVCTIGNIGSICLFTTFRMWFVFIDTIRSQEEEVKNRCIPLRITFRQIVIDRNDMDTLAG